MIEYVQNNSQLLGIIIRSNYSNHGISFFTPDDFSQQLAYMNHPSGKKIDAHVHNIHAREITITQEVLIIKKGKLRVDFYDNDQQYLESIVLHSGDVMLLAAGGHGFEVLEDLEMIEVKQGPYCGDQDKRRFDCVDSSQIKIYEKTRNDND